MALARARGEAGLDVLLGDDRAALREQLARTLAPELASRKEGAPELLDALELATGWDAWRALRGAARTAPSAERVMALTATSLLA